MALLPANGNTPVPGMVDGDPALLRGVPRPATGAAVAGRSSIQPARQE